MLAPADQPLEWAARHSPERVVAVGVLAMRIRRYRSETATPGLGAIPSLGVSAPPRAERPQWHESTGLYGFLSLPPGEQRIEIADPSGRFQAQAVLAQVPDRSATQKALETGVPPAPGDARPLILDVALRPALGMALPPGTSAVWGVVTSGGRPVAGALLTIASVFQGAADSIVGMSGADGSYLLVLPAEVINRGVTPPQRRFERTLTVLAPRPALADALARQGFLAAQPANPFALTPAQRAALFMPRDFQLRDSGGTLHPQVGGQNPSASVSVGEQIRLDIELLP